MTDTTRKLKERATKKGWRTGRRLPICMALCAAMFSATPRHARADCFSEAAQYHHVNSLILRAIALVESRGNARAVNRNNNGSLDVGEMQINSIHKAELARYGINPPDLFDACKNIYIAAWILRRSMNKYGNNWAAIGSYNSATPVYRDRYAARVQAAVRTLVAAGYGDQ